MTRFFGAPLEKCATKRNKNGRGGCRQVSETLFLEAAAAAAALTCFSLFIGLLRRYDTICLDVERIVVIKSLFMISFIQNSLHRRKRFI